MNSDLEDIIRFINTNRSSEDAKTFHKIIDFVHSTTRSDTWYWYPLHSLTKSVPAVVFNLDKLYDNNRIDLIKNTLISCGINDVISFQMQINEQGLMLNSKNMLSLLYESDEDGYNFPWYVETFYFDNSRMWLIYVSHEGTITFAGEDLSKTTREIIPASYLY